jgi:hypothetical protein
VTDGRQFFRGQKDGGSVPAISRSPVQSINPSQERRSLNTIMAVSAISDIDMTIAVSLEFQSLTSRKRSFEPLPFFYDPDNLKAIALIMIGTLNFGRCDKGKNRIIATSTNLYI